MARVRAVRQYVGTKDGFVAWAGTLDDSFIACRDFGHDWRPYLASRSGSSTYARVLRCSRCGTERHQELSSSGHSMSSHYVYPAGYTAPAGTGRMDAADRDALRLESTLRVIDQTTEAKRAANPRDDNVRPLRGPGAQPRRRAARPSGGRKAGAKG